MFAGLTTSPCAASSHARATASASSPRIAAIDPSPTGTASCMYLTTSADDSNGVAEIHRSRRDIGRILAQAMAGHECGFDAARRQHTLCRDAHRQNRRLSVLRQHQFRLRAIEDHLCQPWQRGLGFIECATRFRKRIRVG